MTQKNYKPRTTGVKLLTLSIILTILIIVLPIPENILGYAGLAVIALLLVSLFVGISDARKNRRAKKQAQSVPVTPTQPVAPSPVSVQQPVEAPAAPRPVIKFVPPNEHHGAYLSYSYDDVQIDTSAADNSAIQQIPANSTLTFKRLDGQRVELYSGDLLIGSMYDNKLRSMTYDFLRDPERSALAVLLSSSPVVIGLYFYSSGASFVKKMERSTNAKTFKLVSNGNAEMQDSISCCSEGEVVDISYDYDKEKYLVSVGSSDIGYLPAGFKKYIDEFGDVNGRISEIYEPEDDGEKYTVSIVVIPRQ